MTGRILVTGAAGLVGSGLVPALSLAGFEVATLDLRATGAARGDVRDAETMSRTLGGCAGVVHLAAVSRVLWGERQPELCWATNVTALRQLFRLAEASRPRPWVLFASSREVYGQPATLPAGEDAPLSPVNTYGRSKVAGERLTVEAAGSGLRVAIVRLSNVFGSTGDHPDRVVPAFVRAALAGEPLSVEGPDNTFDFTHLDDTVAGLVALAKLLHREGPPPPPVHLLTGAPTSLGDLARLTVELAGSSSTIELAPPRTFDVARFHGDPRRAHALLGWRAAITLREGLSRLIAAFRREPIASSNA